MVADGYAARWSGSMMNIDGQVAIAHSEERGDGANKGPARGVPDERVMAMPSNFHR